MYVILSTPKYTVELLYKKLIAMKTFSKLKLQKRTSPFKNSGLIKNKLFKKKFSSMKQNTVCCQNTICCDMNTNFTKKVQFYLKLHFGNNGCWVKYKFWFYTVLAWRQSTAIALFRFDSCRSCVQSFNKLFLSPGDHAWKCAFQRGATAQLCNQTVKSFSSRSSYARIFHGSHS